MELSGKKYTKKRKHELAVKKNVEVLFASLNSDDSNAGSVINDILCEYLTQKEAKQIVYKVAKRNKVAHQIIIDELKKIW